MLHTISFHASLLGRELDQNTKSTNAHVLLYGAIEVHTLGEKGCIASNALLAKETGLTPNTVAKCLSQMNHGGWIEITSKGQKHSYRDKIIPLLEIIAPKSYHTVKPVLPDSKTSLTVEYNQSYRTVNRDNSIDNNEVTVESSVSSETTTKQVNEIINQFSLKIDPKNKSYYGREPQREACRFLIEQYGYDETINMIDDLSKVKNIIHPAVLATTPIELRDKWVRILSEVAHKISTKKQQEFYQQKDDNRSKPKTIII